MRARPLAPALASGDASGRPVHRHGAQPSPAGPPGRPCPAAWAKRTSLHVGLLLLLCAVAWAPRLRGPVDLRWDGGVYYILGTSIAEGRGYRLLSEPGEIRAIQYPPLLPLLAAGEEIATGSDPAVAGHALRLTYALVFTGYVLAAYALARRFLAPGWALVAGVATLLHIHTSWLSDLFYAEIPFGLATLLFLLASRASRGRDGSIWEAAAGLLAVAAYLLRTVGVVLLAAWVGEAALRHQFGRAALRLAVALVPVVAWQAYIGHVKGADEYRHPAYAYQRAGYQYYNVGYLENLRYVDPFAPERGVLSGGALAARLAGNLASIPVAVGEAVSSRVEWSREWLRKAEARAPLPPMPLWLAYLPPLVLGVLVGWGIVLMVRRGERLIPLYVAGTLAVVCLLPWPEQLERYLAPLTPLFVVALLLVAASIRSRLLASPASRRRRAALLLTVLLPALVLVQEAVVLGLVYGRQLREVVYERQGSEARSYRLFFYTDAWRLHDAALDWLAPRVEEGAIVATSTPHRFYLKAGRTAVLPPFEPDPARAEKLLEDVPVSYLVLDALDAPDVSRRYAAPVVRAFPDRWERIYSSPDGLSEVYRRRQTTTPAAGSPAAPAVARAPTGGRERDP